MSKTAKDVIKLFFRI